MKHWIGNDWATPVVSRRWAFMAEALHHMKKATGCRLFVHSSHRAWEKAVGA